jgi:hypothetical protein
MSYYVGHRFMNWALRNNCKDGEIEVALPETMVYYSVI